MHVRITRDCVGPEGVPLLAGTVHDLPDAAATLLIRYGLAEVSEPPPAQPNATAGDDRRGRRR